MKGTSPTRSGFEPARHRSAKIEFALFNLITRGEVMEKITTAGIDLAKRVFALHGVDGAGRVGLRKTVRREQLMPTVAALPPCLIGMEACSGAHEWARRFQELGHTVRLMAPVFVAPYRKSGKNDGNDAEAICEAVARPNMRFVPIKSAEQQAVLSLHRLRQVSLSSARQRSIASAACWPSLASSYPSAPTRCGVQPWSWPKSCRYSTARR